jgi:hypothetical protein
MSIEFESKNLVAALSKVEKIVGKEPLVSMSSDPKEGQMTIRARKDLTAVGLTIPAKSKKVYQFGSHLQLLREAMTNRGAIEMVPSEEEVKFKQVKGRYQGRFVPSPYEEISVRPEDKGTRIDAILAATIFDNLKYIQIDPSTDNQQLVICVEVTKKDLQMVIGDNFHFAHFETPLPKEAKSKPFAFQMLVQHLDLIRGFTAEERSGINLVFEANAIFAWTKNTSLVLPTVKAEDYVTLETVHQFQGKKSDLKVVLSTEALSKAASSVNAFFDSGSNPPFELRLKDGKLGLRMSSSYGEGSDKIPVKVKKDYKNVIKVFPYNFMNVINRYPKESTFELVDNATTAQMTAEVGKHGGKVTSVFLVRKE